jgi:hypothetical protein
MNRKYLIIPGGIRKNKKERVGMPQNMIGAELMHNHD